MIRAFLGGVALDIEFTGFAGGERNVRIKGFQHSPAYGVDLKEKMPEGKDLVVYAHIDSSDAIMDLLLFTDAFNRMGRGTGNQVKKVCYVPYLPYARQDRVMVPGEPLSSAVFGTLINLCGFDRIIVDDPHSDVSPSHIKNVAIFEQYELALDILGPGFFDDAVIVAPDAGAIKKVTKLAQKVNHREIGVGTKHRDLMTNNITDTTYAGPDVNGKRVIMVDDICDGGRTFIELGKVLRANGAKEVVLYTTHGIYSYGADVFKDVIDEVYSAYPWMKNLEGRNQNNIFKSVDKMVEFK
ncbi:putative ribose-phosphate pyrophosphokinase [Cronobacter phage PBES 02]|uniref:Putative ribose-phosphate pyrophosphokinase n=1 Tax=Cronobacter phage PBES 02 TaxID=1684115 RepID=A0A0K1YAT7_9CAUD|nr:ribose-phosphate pyrophosphokinase [Cronobacter phage PBES 02]AKY03999.1 putative ribose-phosphate pyrophosphokinase [Cronobacter phage PBES 02]